MPIPSAFVHELLDHQLKQNHYKGQVLQSFLPIVSKQEKERVLYYLERTGLLPLKDKVVNQLSGGQQQRVFLAKLFVQDPEIILLDEPNNHLDIRYQQELIQQLNEWSAQEGKTLIGVFLKIGDNICFKNCL